jgi:hypothetical protein
MWAYGKDKGTWTTSKLCTEYLVVRKSGKCKMRGEMQRKVGRELDVFSSFFFSLDQGPRDLDDGGEKDSVIKSRVWTSVSNPSER